MLLEAAAALEQRRRLEAERNCGVEAPAHLEGASRAALLTDPEARGADAVPVRWHGCRAVVTERHLYTRWGSAAEPKARTLFDLVADPHERFDLSGDVTTAPLVVELDGLLEAD